MRIVFDIEANGLLNSETIDYSASPYRLKPHFEVHCIVAKDIDTNRIYTFVQEEVKTKFKQFVLENVTEVIGHNIINYDLLALKLFLGLDYTVGPDTWGGKPCVITDTLVMSKTLNPDREQHSIDYFGRRLGLEKIDWRAKAVELGLIAHNAPKGEEFKTYHPEMLVYNIRDVEVNHKVLDMLRSEWGTWKWDEAYALEKDVAEIITRQEHRGFWYDIELSKELVLDLDKKMEEIRCVVEPLIPPKKLTKTKAKDYMPPIKQFLKTGKPNSFILKFVEKHGGTLTEVQNDYGSTWFAELLGKEYALPLAQEPLVKEEPSTITDTTHLKEWLVSLGWQPTAWKERDLTVNSKKQKLSQEKFEQSVERYIEQTLESNFCAARCEHLGTNAARLRDKLLGHNLKKPLKVITNPQITVGQEKELCPALHVLEKTFPHAKDVANYLTFRHRRNSILGGGVDPDDEEDAEKGYMSAQRIYEDHRIPTPADTCGCATSRMKHRLVANIPRASSLYGEYMRDLFKAEPGKYYQLGYDGDGLEARIEAHYCYKYTGGPEYAVALVSPKPHDIHTSTAKKISEILGEIFSRDSAKATKYACTYGAQPPKLAKINGWETHTANLVFNGFWEAALPLKMLKEAVTKWWETEGGKKYVPGIDGRKIPTRSAHALLNSLFQSAGLICMKKGMVLHDRWLKEEGLIVDFFTQDYRNEVYAQQMIAYHDEAQFELSKSLVQFKMFPTEEEAKAWTCPEGKIWSDVGHAPDGRSFRAYSRVGELAAKAVNEAGKHYKLKVELTSGYVVGRSWKECH